MCLLIFPSCTDFKVTFIQLPVRKKFLWHSDFQYLNTIFTLFMYISAKIVSFDLSFLKFCLKVKYCILENFYCSVTLSLFNAIAEK